MPLKTRFVRLAKCTSGAISIYWMILMPSALFALGLVLSVGQLIVVHQALSERARGAAKYAMSQLDLEDMLDCDAADDTGCPLAVFGDSVTNPAEALVRTYLTESGARWEAACGSSCVTFQHDGMSLLVTLETEIDRIIMPGRFNVSATAESDAFAEAAAADGEGGGNGGGGNGGGGNGGGGNGGGGNGGGEETPPTTTTTTLPRYGGVLWQAETRIKDNVFVDADTPVQKKFTYGGLEYTVRSISVVAVVSSSLANQQFGVLIETDPDLRNSAVMRASAVLRFWAVDNPGAIESFDIAEEGFTDSNFPWGMMLLIRQGEEGHTALLPPRTNVDWNIDLTIPAREAHT